MIPGIAEIIAGLLSGQYTAEQANAWIQTHMELAVERVPKAEVWKAMRAKAPFETSMEREVREACSELRKAMGNPVISGRGTQTLQSQIIRTAATFIAAKVPITKAAADVLAERERQVSREGWTPAHDDAHTTEELAFAASCYCTADQGEAPPAVWPWDWKWWKPRDHRSNCVRAAALLLAEIERLDRSKTANVALSGDQRRDHA